VDRGTLRLFVDNLRIAAWPGDIRFAEFPGERNDP
jgi:hypothetical protein